ncbi:hypothetical protein [Variovorax sp. HJSM1_2]|uniref:hypothetical protein n=1 Tax=Variovorax sp. HJSM1_2 TaxID=3366263 RepID=UPI003BEE2FE2
MTELIGKVIRCHTDDGYTDVGRVVHIDGNREIAYFIPCPASRRSSKSHRSWHVPSARRMRITDLTSTDHNRELNGALTLVDFVPPPQWRLTDAQLEDGVCLNGLVGKRSQMKKWLVDKQEMLRWITPIIDNYSVADLLEFDAFLAAVNQRAKELEHKDASRVRRALLLWLFGCGDPNALLPCKFRRGGTGVLREFKSKPGRPPKDYLAGRKDTKGYITTQADRANLAKGWRRYMKKGGSVYQAYLFTCAEYWPGPEAVTGENGEQLWLAHPDNRPTENEFRNAAEKRGATRARRLNIDDQLHDLTERALRGSSKNGVRAIGQLGLIDSTSEDQTPVSSVSPLLVLPSSFRTVVMDVRSEYILGIYSGFENPSTLTSLLAILNAASSKVEFCAKYGITITEEEWFARMPKSIRGDNGELKSELGIETLTVIGTSMEFTASYAAVLKNLIEASHRSIHAQADHQSAASTKGRRRVRGEPDRKKEACRTFEQNMYFVIKAILRHNNIVPVPHLITPAMQRDGVKPTRAAIYEWYVKNGFVASAPSDLDSLRTRCLPSLNGVIHREGIRLYNPANPTELIDGLIFNSTWLRQSGLCNKSSKRAEERRVEIKISPDELGHCYFEWGGELRRLENQSLDADTRGLNLLEYLQFADERKSAGRALRSSVEEFDYVRFKENDELNKSAKRAKAKEARKVIDQGGEIVPPRAQSLRTNVAQEKQIHHLQRLGLSKAPQAPSIPDVEAAAIDSAAGSSCETLKPVSVEVEHIFEVEDATAKLMARCRSNRVLID